MLLFIMIIAISYSDTKFCGIYLYFCGLLLGTCHSRLQLATLDICTWAGIQTCMYRYSV